MNRSQHPNDVWASGSSYEPYVGRWSRLVAREFLAWLAAPPGSRWIDVGCGTGALVQAILQQTAPAAVRGIDRSEGYVTFARQQVIDERVTFGVGDAQALPVDSAACDAAVSGLVLNFVPQPRQMIVEMKRVTAPGGTVAAYVWDYAGEMQMMRYFWDAAVALDPAAQDRDEGVRFPICRPDALRELLQAAGLREVETRAIDIPTHFRDFDDYWSPFLTGEAPAPGYALSLSEDRRARLRERIRAALPVEPDGSIRLMARAWAVRGRNP